MDVESKTTEITTTQKEVIVTPMKNAEETNDMINKAVSIWMEENAERIIVSYLEKLDEAEDDDDWEDDGNEADDDTEEFY